MATNIKGFSTIAIKNETTGEKENYLAFSHEDAVYCADGVTPLSTKLNNITGDLENALYKGGNILGDITIENNFIGRLNTIEETELPEIKASLETMKKYLNGYLNVKQYMEIESKSFVDVLKEGFEKIYLEKDGQYTITEPITLKEMYIKGDNANITLQYSGIVDQGFIKLDNIKQLDGVNFICNDSQVSPLVRMINNNNLTVENTTITQNVLTNKSAINSCLDVFSNNNNLTFNKCVFNQYNQSNEGGIWVREGTTNNVSNNITFDNCTFNQKGSNDEILAVWGWLGTVKDIIIENCKFNTTPTNGYSASYVITLGQSGKLDNAIFRNNIINCGELRHGLIRMNELADGLGSENTNILIENNVINILKTNASYNRGVFYVLKANAEAFICTSRSVIITKNTVNTFSEDLVNKIFCGVCDAINNNINVKNVNIPFTRCKNVIGNNIVITKGVTIFFDLCKYISKNEITHKDVLSSASIYSAIADARGSGLTDFTLLKNSFNMDSDSTTRIFSNYINTLVDSNYINCHLNFIQCRDMADYIVFTNNHFKTGATPSTNATNRLYKNNIINNKLVDDVLLGS